jgi:acyl-CoA thioesterase-2
VPDFVDNLVDLLDLEELDVDLYRGRNDVTANMRGTLFGGQVAAQALRAAASTVPEGRHPHSMHGYFLRPGLRDRPVIFHVERDRDGRTFSARHLVAAQHGEAIFTLTASFKVAEESGTYVPSLPDVPVPENIEPAPRQWHPGFEVRNLPGSNGAQMWARYDQPLPDDRLLHTCALTYLSDMSSGFSDVQVPGLAPGGPSISHSLWFHDHIRVDEWVLMRKHPVLAGDARGLYQGHLHSSDGRLGAVVSQEMLLRLPFPPAGRTPAGSG